MEKQAKDFLKVWVLTCVFLSMFVITFNVVLDPYLLFGISRMPGINARKPAADTQQRLMKAYDVLRAKPNSLILGSSRVAMGLDTQHPSWPVQDRPIYNLGIGAGGPYIAYRYLQHVMSHRHVSLVIFGLEFQYFVTSSDTEQQGTESRLSVNRDGSINSGENEQHIRDIFHASLSLDAFADGAETLAANLGGGSSDLIDGNWDFGVYQREVTYDGSYPLVAASNLADIYLYNKPPDPRPIAYVKAILDLCEAHATRVILFISPSRADEFEIIDLAGQWQNFEDWKRNLVELTAKYADRDGRTRIPLWDFSGYDLYSTEAVSADRRTLHWFWESSHYHRVLGDLIIKRIFDGGDMDFGVLLSPSVIERHLADIRGQQRSYRARHYDDAQRVRELYDLAVKATKGQR